MQAKPPLKIVLCSPRGFCAGVVRAIDTVERALTIYGAPVYVRHEIVHNRYVVDSLRTKGAIFVEELAEIPDNTNAPVVFSAHGVPKSVPADARARNFFSLDATCPLVTKVHREAAIHFKRGREILLIGHSHHPEVVGTLGQLPPGAVTLIETAHDAATFTPKDPNNLAFVTQTTLSIDDTAEIVAMLKERFPNISGPHKEDICYATTNRQLAVKKVAPVVDALIVVGAPNSSNSQRLREVAEREGCPIAVLAQRASDLDWSHVRGHQEPRHHRGRLGAGSDRRRDHGCVRRALRTACGDGLGRGRERILSAAAFAAARRGVERHGGLHRRRRRRACGIPGRLRHRRTAVLQGHRRGRREFQLPAAHHGRLFHPDAVREARRQGRPAVLSRPDDASRRPRHHLSAAGEEQERRGAEHAGRPARGDHQFSRRHLAAQAQRRALRRRRPGAGENASGGPRFSDVARQRAVGVGLASAVRSGRVARRRSAARPARLSSAPSSIISKAASGRRICRKA